MIKMIRAEEAWLQNDFAAEARYYERSSTSNFDSAVEEESASCSTQFAFFLGRYEEGKRWASEVLRLREEDSGLRTNTAAVALSHLAVEATRAGAPNAVALMAEAERILKQHHYSDALLVLDRIKSDEQTQVLKPAPEKTLPVLNARTWRHDAANNILIAESLKPFKE
ncbi:hypothetical protein AWB77_04475 [Caballeronia fortuita]|uniref:Uncharacterized protein n=1 Tax=Caballeronia fortuita TaxID=1777138 RepID=A0A158CSH9_9BURK|nr:hypothetical protein [Caballeronia fortuita]SAK85332.1 hypothetical protein AWB77_04475 [Caballeronia fortuita]